MTDGTPSDFDAPLTARVGRLLAEERERLGLSVEQAAEALRLKPSYVESIEKSRLEDLPGTTYAAGFVRAYAEFLGLDAVEVLRRFREETETLTRRTALSFPSPVSEGRVPSRFILMASAVVAIFIYAAWHFFTSSERNMVEAVPPVPAQISPPPSESEGQDGGTDSAGTIGAADGSAAVSAPAERAASDPSKPASNAQTDGQTPRGPAQAEEQGHAAAPAPVAAAPTEQTSAATGQAARPSSGGDTGSIAGAAPAMAGQDPQLASRRPAGSEGGDSRIVIRANADSWIEIQDGDGSVLLRQILRTGDSFRVPNRPGLSLMTGNAGGIEISVDGKPGRRMGPTGFVRRNIPLDPDQLSSGAIGE